MSFVAVMVDFNIISFHMFAAVHVHRAVAKESLAISLHSTKLRTGEERGGKGDAPFFLFGLARVETEWKRGCWLLPNTCENSNTPYGMCLSNTKSSRSNNTELGTE